jgi:2-keto-4-pentenoate hydratase/2-oxohepta-3-ene-1,7-dioic acid hydratase in catechol pathway
MKLATFRRHDEVARIGVVGNGYLVDIAGSTPRTMLELVGAEPEALNELRQVAAQGIEIPLDSVELLAPIPQPPEYLGVGLNYREHAREAGLALPKAPLIFNKQTSCVSGPRDDVMLPLHSEQLDFEGELGIVIGHATRNMSLSAATEAIWGYVVTNDFSVRDWQLSSPTHTLGKSFDTHGPMGPWIVTADEIQNPQNLSLVTTINGQVRQNGNTADMIFSCQEIVAFISQFMTLKPGSIITTGTPSGVGYGCRPPTYLRAGDSVSVTISDIGCITNRVVPEWHRKTR